MIYGKVLCKFCKLEKIMKYEYHFENTYIKKNVQFKH